MLFNQFNWMDIEHYLQQDNRVVLVTGTTHQHGYLSLTTGINTPLTLAQVVCADLNVLIAPPLPYGVSDMFSAYPGTIAISKVLFSNLLLEVLEQLIEQGFSRILISNGHGGNSDSIREVIEKIEASSLNATVDLFEWFRDIHVLQVAEMAGLAPNHGNWFENLPFNQVQTVRELPSEVKPMQPLQGITEAAQLREVLGDGSFGGPYEADNRIIETIINVAAETMAIKLRLLKQADS